MLTFSWQKALGGEAQHGMAVLSPVLSNASQASGRRVPCQSFSAFHRAESSTGLFQGFTINTPSMLAVEDFAFALSWPRELADSMLSSGGRRENARTVYACIERTPGCARLRG